KSWAAVPFLSSASLMASTARVLPITALATALSGPASRAARAEFSASRKSSARKLRYATLASSPPLSTGGGTGLGRGDGLGIGMGVGLGRAVGVGSGFGTGVGLGIGTGR